MSGGSGESAETPAGAAAAPLLRLRGIVKQFGRLRALDGIDLDVHEGDAIGIIGPNGAGKSTLFNVITRIPFGPDSGAIEWRGQALPISARQICRAGVARTFQRENTFDTLSVEETLRVSAAYGATSERGGIDEALERCGLANIRDQESQTLSLLDKRRLMLASALVTNPSVLLLDEPAAGLTKSEQDEFIKLLQEVRATGVTLVVIEHILAVLMKVVERLVVIAAGQKLVEAEPEEVMRHPEVVEAYLGTKAAA